MANAASIRAEITRKLRMGREFLEREREKEKYSPRKFESGGRETDYSRGSGYGNRIIPGDVLTSFNSSYRVLISFIYIYIYSRMPTGSMTTTDARNDSINSGIREGKNSVSLKKRRKLRFQRGILKTFSTPRLRRIAPFILPLDIPLLLLSPLPLCFHSVPRVSLSLFESVEGCSLE